ncbi:hypothetical protein GR11A_00058 [Vibrio phage vB_VcorM_GR11A]|nr:hypothetical protein GR11A_00058 [Vibrio phage vB_VcorM_GR11A]
MFNYLFRGYRHLPADVIRFLDDLENCIEWTVYRVYRDGLTYKQNRGGAVVAVSVTRYETFMDGVHFEYDITGFSNVVGYKHRPELLTAKQEFVLARNIHRILTKRLKRQYNG